MAKWWGLETRCGKKPTRCLSTIVSYMHGDLIVIFIVIISLYHPEIMSSNSQFISKLSSCYTRPILNDKLSISNHVLTMWVVLGISSWFINMLAMFYWCVFRQFINLLFCRSLWKRFLALSFRRSFLTRFLVWQLATMIIATLALLVNLLSTVKISLTNPPRSTGIMNSDHHDPSGSKRFINHRDPSG